MDTSVTGDPLVTPTARLVAGMSVLATVLPSSIARAPHSIPEVCTSAGEFASLLWSCDERLF